MTKPKELDKRFGQLAKKLKQRLDELEAAENLAVIGKIPGARCHELTGNRKGQLSVDLSKNQRLFFEPDHDPQPEKEEGGLEWEQVTQVRILEVEDPH